MLLKLRNSLPLALFLSFAFLLGSAVILQNRGVSNPLFKLFSAFPHFDKFGHFFLMGMLNYFFLLFARARFSTLTPKLILLLSAFTTLVVGIEELSQAWVPTRTCSWFDFIASLLGISLAALFASLKISRPRV